MALVTSGNPLLMQGTSDTNPSTSSANELYNQTMTTGLDGYLVMQQLIETGDGIFTPTTTWQGDMYGFNSASSNFSSSYIHNRWPMNAALAAGENRRFSSQSAYGSLGATTYSDDSSTTRTIRILTWGVPDSAPSPNTNNRVFCFALSGTGVTNSNDTFEKLEITTNGGTTVTINRTDLAYDSSESGNSWWEWHGSSGTMYNNVGSLGTPSSGTSYTVKIISGTTTTTKNTGIAEEFGGADSSDVTLSHYYKGASQGYVNSGVPTQNIPTSGEISFSDFYGASYVSGVSSSVEIQPAAKYETQTGPRGGQYEFILHGFGPKGTHDYASTIGSSPLYNSPISSTRKQDTHQGSIVSGSATNWGVSSAMGSLLTLCVYSNSASANTIRCIMIVTGTGSNSNSGFTNLTATRSGMSTLTLSRTSATYLYSSTATARIWIWDDSDGSPTLGTYHTGYAYNSTADTTLFPGGTSTNNTSISTTTSSRTTWTIS